MIIVLRLIGEDAFLGHIQWRPCVRLVCIDLNAGASDKGEEEEKEEAQGKSSGSGWS